MVDRIGDVRATYAIEVIPPGAYADVIAAGPQVVTVRMTPDGIMVEVEERAGGMMRPVRIAGRGPGPTPGDVTLTLGEPVYVGTMVAFGHRSVPVVPYVLIGTMTFRMAVVAHAEHVLRGGSDRPCPGWACAICDAYAIRMGISDADR